MRLQELGEWELLQRLSAFAPAGQLDDDAALLRERSGRTLVVNTDVLVEGVHFSATTVSPQDLGWRAAAANLSDLAAMGCTDVEGLTVGLVAPGDTPWDWVEGVYRGLSEALARYGGCLLGGDCSSGGQRLLTITALGHLSPERGAGPIRRGDGRPGDWLICSGPHGLSRLGLALLQGELAQEERDGLPPELQEEAIRAHQRPRPRLDVVQELITVRPEHCTWRVGGTDSSDGLQLAAVNIARASGCGVLLEKEALPLAPEFHRLPQAERWCLGGGEDFELVLALEPVWAEALCAAMPDCSRIGRLIDADAHRVCWADSGEPLDPAAGYCHFQ
jgi:thiamine-monophosphate kinase